jgi:hypothetical protein
MTRFYFDPSREVKPGERRIEVPARLAGKGELLDFLARAFPLPVYFGHNWDALEECLLDLDWLAGPPVALVHHDIPLAAAPSDQLLYLRILAAAAAASPRLHVTFPAANRAAIDKLLAR